MSSNENAKKLLDILSQPEIVPNEDKSGDQCEFDPNKEVKKAFPGLSMESQQIMAKLLEAEMPTPEEIAEAERIARHNAEIARRRQERLKLRKLKKIARQQGKKGKKHRRNSRG